MKKPPHGSHPASAEAIEKESAMPLFMTIAPEVTAWKITKVGDLKPEGLDLFCEDGQNRIATPRMLARALVPRAGDYFVVQDPKYSYIATADQWMHTHTPQGAGHAPIPPQTHGAGGGANAA
jgi:hypothetical protein